MRRRAAVMVAAAAAAAAIVSIVGVRVVESVQDTNRIVAAASDVRSARMTGANGVDVGNVFVSNGKPSSVVVNVTYGVPSGHYGIEFRTGSTAKRLADAEQVPFAVAEPRAPLADTLGRVIALDVGDAVHGAQAGDVDLLEHHA